MKHTNIKKNNLISIILVLALVAGCFATIPLVMSQDSTDKDGTWQILNSSADAVTQIPNGIDDGTVWTDKSIVDNGDGSFAITLSAFGRRWAMTHEEYIERYKPINVVFVLDISGSMGTADVAAMIDATKQAGEMILNANPDNRVAAVYYSNTAREVSTEWRWVDKNNFATTLGALPRPSSGGTTNIVAGLNLAKNLLDNAPNKDLATPVIILMTDGGPNCYYTNTNWQGTAATDGYVSISGVSAGEPVAASETIKRAAIISDAGVRIYTVGYNINGNPLAWLTLNPSNDIGYLAPGITERYINADWVGTSNTLRFSTTSKPVDTNTLRSVDIANAPTLSNLGHTVETIEYFQYNEKFYAPLVPQDLVNSFKEVVNNIMTDLASPIKAGENLVITDVIGEGFVLDGNQNPAITYDAATHTVTWTIPASQLCLFDPSNWNDGDAPYSIDAATAKMNKVTFTVTAIGEPLSRDIDNYNGKQYYTNNLASSKYVNHEDNLITKDLTNRGWVTYNFVPNTSDYSIEYYYDTLLDASKTDTDTAPIGSVISTYTDKVITGYKFDKTENLPLIISANVADNVIKVFYVKDDSQTKELSYEVAYYLDGVFKETVTVTKTVWINDDA
ncbi:MAG: VWA domain-containing protein, partial [Nitrososphaerota archaeon]|nr:VWA domain-containing protein [Nitrososphaerota archaeon]